MSKLKTIRDALESNPEAVVLGPVTSNLSLDRYASGANIGVTFFAAPRQSPQGFYTKSSRHYISESSLAELKRFMGGLVPGIEPNGRVDFQSRKRRLHGDLELVSVHEELTFDEVVGRERVVREMDITDGELRAYCSDKGIPFRREESIDYLRRVRLYVFPTEQLAEKALSYATAWHPSGL